MTSWFTLKATTDAVATEWMQTISHAQKCYTAAVEKKAQYCKVLQSLKTSRILNGLENRVCMYVCMYARTRNEGCLGMVGTCLRAKFQGSF